MVKQHLARAAGRIEVGFSLLFLALGFGLRAYQLPDQILADDEWHALHALLAAGYGEIATHFGGADHSIPLTLLFKLMLDTIGLSEWLMRLPSFLTGIAAPLLLPYVVGGRLRPIDRRCFVMLLSISALLIYFSRIARPYALVALLSFVGIVAFDRFWRTDERRWALGYVLAVAAAGYLHPVSLCFGLAPLGYAALRLLLLRGRQEDWRRWLALCGATGLALLLLLGPPLYVDAAALAQKSGVDASTWYALSGGLHLWVGSGSRVLVGLLVGLAAWGAVRSWRAQREWLVYCSFCSGCLIVAVLLSFAAHLSEPIVVARYMLPALPVFSMLAATGLGELAGRFDHPVPRYGLPVALGAALVLTGPIPEQLRYPNQFSGHMVSHFDYRRELNSYRELRPARVPEFYTMLGREEPGSRTLIETPWRYEWDYNVLGFYQETHRQRIKIGFLGELCGYPTRGEYPDDATGMAFRGFVPLSRVLAAGPSAGDYVVFHLAPPWPPGLPVPPIDRCVERFRSALGAPVFEDGEIVVFALGR